MSLYGYALQFASSEQLQQGAIELRRRGYSEIESYSPHPLADIDEVLGSRPSRLPVVALIGGIFGCVGGFYLQCYIAIQQYPLNVGGRPLFSWPAFIPVTFELTVLCSGLLIFTFFFIFNRLPELHHPLFNLAEFERATDDRYFLCLRSSDRKFAPLETRRSLTTLGGVEGVYDVEE